MPAGKENFRMRSIVLLVCLALGGCQAGYYWHLVKGHGSLMGDRKPVSGVLKDASVPEPERRQLRQARDILAFAGKQLNLPVEDSYSDYVALERDWVVWNLFAAPEFSLEPRQWCYPVAGCVSYRGYFDRERAERHAERLRQKGLDVHGAGAVAYSTLGWFDDPLTTPMLRRQPAALAELLFHELAHRWLYVSGETRFNESLATALAAEATRRWLARNGDADAIRTWRARERATRKVTERVRTARRALKDLYARDLAPEAMREQKRAEQRKLRAWYERARSRDPALDAWQGWFDGPLNNAQLNTLLDYNDHVPAFNQLLLDCGGHWACFRERIAALADMDAERRTRTLEQLHD
jgi:predicted aminopeptidase